MTLLIKVFLLLILQFRNTLAIASCVPCICLRSYGARKADCSRKIVNFTMTNIPDFINSDIQILNMTQHNLVTLKNETFVNVNLTELTSLYLDRCNIKKIEKEAFKDLTYLTDLSLMYNDIHELDPGLFETNVFMKYLWIENNKIKHLPNGLFDKLENFQGLFARFNEISHVDDYLFNNNEYLWIIDLSNNKLNYLNSELITKTNISIIFIQENPFVCDCLLRDLHKTMELRNLYNKTQPTCAFPNRLHGKEISTLSSSDFKCWLNTTINPNKNIEIYDNENRTIQCINNGLPKAKAKLLNYKGEIIEPSYYYEEDTKYFHNFSITNLNENDSGLYECFGYNQIFNKTSQPLNITVIKTEKPSVKIYHPSTMTFNQEIYNLTFSCQYFGIPKPVALWKYNNTDIVPSNLKYSIEILNSFWVNLTISVLNYNNSGNYSCIAENSRQSVHQDIQISVSPSFEPRIKLFGNENIVEDENVTLSCFIQTYSKPIDLSWTLKNKTIILNNTITTKINNNQSIWYNITIFNATIENTGSYECVVSTKEANKTAYHYLNIIKKYLVLQMGLERENSNIIIWCLINGYPNYSTTWTYINENNSIVIENVTDKYLIQESQMTNEISWSNLTIINATYEDNGKYSCFANNSKYSKTKYVLLNEKEVFIYWYIAIALFIFILTICFIKICMKCKNKTEENMKTNFNEYKVTNDNKIMTEIPMLDYSNEEVKPNEADIMFILDRELTTYNLMEQK